MTTETEAKILVTAEDRASAVIMQLRNDINKLGDSLRRLSSVSVPNVGASITAKTNAAIRGIRAQATAQAQADRQQAGGAQALDRQRVRFDAAAMRAYREKIVLSARMARQQAGETQAAERQRRAVEAATGRDMRQRMAFITRMGRQQAAAIRETERERQRSAAAAEREHAAATRRRISMDAYRFRLRERSERQEATAERRQARDADRGARGEERRRAGARHDLHQGTSRVGDVAGRVSDTARTVTFAGAIAGGIVAKLAQTGFMKRAEADTAEANLRMFGGQTQSQVEQARSGWLNRAAIDSGFTPAKALNAFTETLKAGIPEIAAPDVTRSIMGASAGLDLNVAETTKLVGRLSTLTQDPKAFRPEAIDQMLNAIAVVAKVTAADSNELVSSLRRGAGVLGSSKMSVGDLTAFTGTAISAGMQEGKAGTFMDFAVNELVNAKNARGQRQRDLDQSFNLLGIGSRAGVSRQAANDPTALLLKVFERLSKMAPEKAGQVASLLGMREWRGEVLMMAKAAQILRQTVEAQRDPKNAGHLAQARAERLGALDGLRSQLRAAGALAWEAIGGGIEDIAREIGGFFLDVGKTLRLDVLKAHVRTFLDGIVDGLGFASARQMLQRALGSGGLSFDSLNGFFRIAQGFGQGVREMADTMRRAFGMFAGQDASAETIGRLGAKLLGLSFAVATISPFVGTVAALGTALGGLALAGVAVSRSIGALAPGALVGAGGATAFAAGIRTAASRVVAGLLGGLGLGIAAEIGANRAAISALMVSGVKSLFETIVAGIRDGVAEWRRDGWFNGFLRLLDPNFARDPGKPTVQKQSTTEVWGGLIQPASFTSFSGARELSRSIDGLGRRVDAMGARVQLASLSAPAASALASFGVSSGGNGGSGGGLAPGAPGDPAKAFGSRFYTPPGAAVPGWFGKGSPGSGGSASSNPANSAASAAMLDAIASTESGKAGYDAVLGNGRYGTPSKAVSSMTLDEAFAFGRQVRARHGSSSALGRYQIVGTTMRAAQKALGVSGDAPFDPAMQDRMARWIARSQGLGAWEGLKGNSRAMAAARAAMAQGGAQDAPNGGTSAIGAGIPGLSGNGQFDGLRIKGGQAIAGGVHPLDGKGRLSSDFGMRRHPISGALKMHQGIDLAAPAGTAVKAIRDGIASIGRSGDVTVKGADGSSQAYRHIVAGIREGARVAAGQTIGTLRAHDPRSTGPHLHLESRDASGRLMDPKALLAPSAETVARWKSGPGGNAAALAGAAAAPTAEGLARDVAKPPTSPSRGGPPGLDAGGTGFRPSGPSAGGGGTGAPVSIVIHAGNQNPQELAGHVQRHVTEAWNYRSHDMEPELT